MAIDKNNLFNFFIPVDWFNKETIRLLHNAINALGDGRSRSIGDIQLRAEDALPTTTTISAQFIMQESVVTLAPLTARAASHIASIYTLDSDITNKQFIITHPATTTATTTASSMFFRYSIQG